MRTPYRDSEAIKLLFLDGNKWINETRREVTPMQIKELMDNCTPGAFITACKALKIRGGKEDFDLLSDYLGSDDHFKHRVALRWILYFPEGIKRYSRLAIELLNSDELLDRKAALELIADFNIKLENNYILEVINNDFSHIYSFCALEQLPDTSILSTLAPELFKRASRIQREGISDLIRDYTTDADFDTNFRLLATDGYHKIRINALRLAIRYSRDDLVGQFLDEKDGHIRKLAIMAQRVGAEKLYPTLKEHR